MTTKLCNNNNLLLINGESLLALIGTHTNCKDFDMLNKHCIAVMAEECNLICHLVSAAEEYLCMVCVSIEILNVCPVIVIHARL